VGLWKITTVDGQVFHDRYRNGTVVERIPHPPSYWWSPVQLDVALGGMFGDTTSVQLRANAAWILGRASSRDASHARGRFIGIGGALAYDVEWMDGARQPNRASLGPSVIVGWGFDAYEPTSPIPDTHLYARATAFSNLSGSDGWGVRVGLGITSPRWSRRVYRGLKDLTFPPYSKPDSTVTMYDGIRAVGLFAAWVLSPLLAINHVELTAELDRRKGTFLRYGVMLGWGL